MATREEEASAAQQMEHEQRGVRETAPISGRQRASQGQNQERRQHRQRHRLESWPQKC